MVKKEKMSRQKRTHREKTQPLNGFWLEGFRERRVAEAAFCIALQ